MHTFVIECVVRRAEERLIGFAVVEGSIVLTRHEPHGLGLKILYDLLKLAHTLTTLYRVIGRVRKIASKHDEVGLVVEAVDRSHRFF